ncbi:GLUG motif-containing protein, partial [Pseudomonas aeruginosa]|uniref:GLUG motif-containing protein n=1 Tax=Pseudomonas aeruginosa TaxID=287 RepID=UPI002AA2A3D6
SGPSSLGALVGINSGRIANVSASGVSVVGSRLRSNALGGLVGLNAKATIRASGSQGKVETYRPGLNVGGLVGYNMFGHV